MLIGNGFLASHGTPPVTGRLSRARGTWGIGHHQREDPPKLDGPRTYQYVLISEVLGGRDDQVEVCLVHRLAAEES